MERSTERKRLFLEMKVRGVIRRTLKRGVEGFTGWVAVIETSKIAYDRRLERSRKLLEMIKEMKD